jgi:hypothetical protein
LLQLRESGIEREIKSKKKKKEELEEKGDLAWGKLKREKRL